MPQGGGAINLGTAAGNHTEQAREQSSGGIRGDMRERKTNSLVNSRQGVNYNLSMKHQFTLTP
jgi:hypothetical protein